MRPANGTLRNQGRRRGRRRTARARRLVVPADRGRSGISFADRGAGRRAARRVDPDAAAEGPRIAVYSNQSAKRYPDDVEDLRACLRNISSARCNSWPRSRAMYADGARVFVSVGPKARKRHDPQIIHGKPHRAVSCDDGSGGLTDCCKASRRCWRKARNSILPGCGVARLPPARRLACCRAAEPCPRRICGCSTAAAPDHSGRRRCRSLQLKARPSCGLVGLSQGYRLSCRRYSPSFRSRKRRLRCQLKCAAQFRAAFRRTDVG